MQRSRQRGFFYYLDAKTVTETVTVETSSDDLTDVLAALAPSIPYDDGEYVGELA